MKLEFRFMAPVCITVEVPNFESAAKAARIIADTKGWNLLGVAAPEFWSQEKAASKPTEVTP